MRGGGNKWTGSRVHSWSWKREEREVIFGDGDQWKGFVKKEARDEEMDGGRDLGGLQPTQQGDERWSQRKQRAVSTDKPPAWAVKSLCSPNHNSRTTLTCEDSTNQLHWSSYNEIWLLNTECNSNFSSYNLGQRENTFIVSIRCLCNAIFLHWPVK